MKTTRQAHQNKYSILIGKTWRSPVRAILLHSPGHKPWVRYCNTFIEPQRGGTLLSKTNARAESAAPTELFFCFVCVSPGLHFGLCPHFTLGFAGVSCLKALVISLIFDVGALLILVERSQSAVCRGRTECVSICGCTAELLSSCL